jgi:hypothetical protein
MSQHRPRRRGTRPGVGVGCLVCALFLAGCTGWPIVQADVSDYRTVFGTTSDEQLLVGILRAKDRAPLHFAELQSVGASIQLSSNVQATAPFGELHDSTQRAMLQGTAGVQNGPNFSLTTLETQAFTKGLLSPVDATVIKQLLDEGIDPAVIFLVFFSTVTDSEGVQRNNIECETEEDCLRHFFRYLSAVNRITSRMPLIANIFVELTPVGDPVAGTMGIKDLSGIDPAKFRVLSHDGKQRLFSVSSPKIAICTKFGGRTVSAITMRVSEGCASSEVILGSARPPDRPPRLTVRSAYQIIEYLGQILRYQEARASENRCVKLRADFDHRRCDEGDVLFQVNAAKGSPLLTTIYRGSPYSLSIGPCTHGDYCDHSAEVLKILNLLINVNKSASDIPQVPLVRTIQ